jgi:hypothetical protein
MLEALSTLQTMGKRADRDTSLGWTLHVAAAEFDRTSTSCGEEMRWRR